MMKWRDVKIWEKDAILCTSTSIIEPKMTIATDNMLFVNDPNNVTQLQLKIFDFPYATFLGKNNPGDNFFNELAKLPGLGEEDQDKEFLQQIFDIEAVQGMI